MKKIYLIFIILCAYLYSGISQNDSLSVIGYRDVDGVYLRWAPGKEIFKQAMTNGFRISRYENSDDFEKFRASKRILVNMTTINTSNAKAAQARNIMNANIKDSISNQRNFKDAVNYTNNKESQYFVTMLLAEGDFEAAKALGLGYFDRDPGATKEFVYEVEILGLNTKATYATKGVTTTLPSITDLSHNSEDKTALLIWDFKEHDKNYASYEVYRSSTSNNTGSMTCLNCTDPLIPMVTSEEQTQATYLDNLADNTTTYYYAIKGKNSFGIKGPFSNVVQLQGKPKSLNVELKIHNPTFSGSSMTLSWSLSNSSFNNDMEGYNVYRLLSIDGNKEKLNNTLLSKTIFSFTINNPVSAAYYYIESIDKNGARYESIAVLGQPADIEAPAAPHGLEGFISRTGEVSLKWISNDEKDLDGYQVMFANEREGTYSQLTKEPTKNNEFQTTINTEFSVDSIFFKITAVDNRFNSSPFSEILAIKRPDITPPATPLINHLLGREEGVRISWVLPSDRDLMRVALERKVHTGSNWQTIHEVNLDDLSVYNLAIADGELINSNWIDTSKMEHRLYDYRIVAEDDSRNISISKVKSTKPYDDGIRGSIDELHAILLTANIINAIDDDGNLLTALLGGTVPGGSNPGGGTGTNTGSGNLSGKSPRPCRLEWTYTTEFPKSLMGFRIYRKVVVPYMQTSNQEITYINTNTDYTLIKTVPFRAAIGNASMSQSAFPYVWFDKTVMPLKNHRYMYKIVAEHSDGGASKWSREVYITYFN